MIKFKNKNNRIAVLILFLMVGFNSYTNAQIVVTGQVLDDELGTGIPGVTVTEENTENSTVTNDDGFFELNTQENEGSVIISLEDYEEETISFSGNTSLGEISMYEVGSIENLEETIIVGKGIIDLAKDRETPVAANTVTGDEILEDIGAQDITSALLETPSFALNDQSAGYGDGNIRVRGFRQTQIAWLLNGQPISSMEDGQVLFSDYSGISDVTSFLQVQRGLGSSKLAISSVGGSVNIVTKTTDKKQGGRVRLVTANDGDYRITAGYNTGKMDNGLAVSALLSYREADGYANGAYIKSQTYFLSVGYQPDNSRHNFNLLFLTAPNERGPNRARTIQEYLDFGRRFNNGNGFFQGRRFWQQRNFANKPVLNLNWDYQINEKSSLSTVLYGTWSMNGGTNQLNNGANVQRREDGTIDFDALYADNLLNPNQGGIADSWVVRGQIDRYNWYGTVLNFNHEFNDKLSVNVGTDARTYNGQHYRYVQNFHGLNNWSEVNTIFNQNNQPLGQVTQTVTQDYPSISPYTRLFDAIPTDQRIQRDYSERITYSGLFSQLEYVSNILSAYLQGSYSTQYYRKFNRLNYLDGTGDSERVTRNGYNIKGGANFNFTKTQSAFFNIGFYDTPPLFVNVFQANNNNDNNVINPFVTNEKSWSAELGYKLRTRYLNIDVNLYRTAFKDRVRNSTIVNEDTGETFSRVNFGVEQVHKGVEFEFATRKKFHRKLQLKGTLSIGDWEYRGNRERITYDLNGSLVLDDDGNPLIEIEDVDGGKVGDAAQTVATTSAKYDILKNLTLKAKWRMNANYYANEVTKNNVKLPTWHIFKVGATYSMKLAGSHKLKFSANVNNVFNNIFLSDLNNALPLVDENGDPILGDDGQPLPTYDGIRTDSTGRFGLGRTWNASVIYTF